MWQAIYRLVTIGPVRPDLGRLGECPAGRLKREVEPSQGCQRAGKRAFSRPKTIIIRRVDSLPGELHDMQVMACQAQGRRRSGRSAADDRNIHALTSHRVNP